MNVNVKVDRHKHKHKHGQSIREQNFSFFLFSAHSAYVRPFSLDVKSYASAYKMTMLMLTSLVKARLYILKLFHSPFLDRITDKEDALPTFLTYSVLRTL